MPPERRRTWHNEPNQRLRDRTPRPAGSRSPWSSSAVELHAVGPRHRAVIDHHTGKEVRILERREHPSPQLARQIDLTPTPSSKTRRSPYGGSTSTFVTFGDFLSVFMAAVQCYGGPPDARLAPRRPGARPCAAHATPAPVATPGRKRTAKTQPSPITISGSWLPYFAWKCGGPWSRQYVKITMS
jgi:hypothetical protein